VGRKKEGKRYLYHALINKKQAYGNIFIDLKKRIFGDSGVLMAAAFLNSYVVSDSEMEEIQRLFEIRAKEHDS
jgi:predicted transcriptional regulator